MHPILSLLKRRVVLFDGAMGTALFERGLSGGAPPEGWNLEHPERVQAVHRDYYDAGSDVVQTNTFGGNRLRLEHHGLADRLEEINRRAAELARAACAPGRLVAGDIGPSGKFLPPVGDLREARLEEVFAEQAGALAEAGVDLISIESMSDVREAACAVRGACRTGLPVFAALTFMRNPRGFFTMWGNTVADGMKRLEEEGANVVGANCTLGSADMTDLAPLLCAAARRSVIVQPNAGQPRLVGGRVEYPASVEEFVADVGKILDAGVSVIGGCCGTTPDIIRAIAALLRKRGAARD